jgi:hypothetical protein
MAPFQRNEESVEVNRDQLRWVVGILTGNYHLKGHLFKLGLTDYPTSDRCLEKDESAIHVLCDCEAIAYLRSCYLRQFFMEPSDYYDAPRKQSVTFQLRCRINKGLIKGEAQ